MVVSGSVCKLRLNVHFSFSSLANPVLSMQGSLLSWARNSSCLPLYESEYIFGWWSEGLFGADSTLLLVGHKKVAATHEASHNQCKCGTYE